MSLKTKYKSIITPSGAIIKFPDQEQEIIEKETTPIETDRDILIRIENKLNIITSHLP